MSASEALTALDTILQLHKPDKDGCCPVCCGSINRNPVEDHVPYCYHEWHDEGCRESFGCRAYQLTNTAKIALLARHGRCTCGACEDGGPAFCKCGAAWPCEAAP